MVYLHSSCAASPYLSPLTPRPLLFSPLTGEAAKYAIYILYTSIAIGATVGMTTVRNMKAEETAGGDAVTIEKIDVTKKVGSSSRG